MVVILVYIKEMRMHGFKSFGTKASVKFDTRFNCLIGPNGSGKSNIIDALIFVLGTRSTKTMRADTLKDLLYSGQGGNKPAEEAKVEIIFDNSDFAIPYPETELNVSREIKKNGQSVYRLNNKRITKSEILDKLKLAGIDPVNGYNVIAQGQVAEIIGMSGEDRRKLLEDIAGTSSFDEKKIESLKGLEEAKRRLDELNILVAEIFQQHAAIKVEKQKMEKYLEITQIIKEFKLKIYRKSFTQLEEKLSNIHGQINDLQEHVKQSEESNFTDKVTDLNKLLTDYEESVETINFEMDSIKSEIKDLEISSIRIEEEVRYTKNEINSRNQSKKHAQEQIDDLTKKVTKNISRESELNEELEDLNTKFLNVEQETLVLQDKIEDQKKIQDELFIQYGDKEREYRKYNQKLTQISVKKEYSSSILENYEKGLHQKEIQIESINLDLNTKRNDFLRIREAIEKTELIKEETSSSIQKNESIRDDLEREISTKDIKLREFEDEILVLKTQLKTIEEFMEMSKSDPAYDYIVSKDMKGIHGKLADFYPEGELPKEILHLANYIVVENLDTAKSIIKSLKKDHIGSTRLIPKLAFGKIDADPLSFVRNISKRREHAKNIDDAVKKWIVNKDKIVVSDEGDIIYPDGTVFGGYFSESAKEELETVTSRLNALQEQKNTIYNSREKLQEQYQEVQQKIRDLVKKIEDIQTSLNNANKQFAILEQSIGQVQISLQNLEKERFPILTHIEDKIGESNDFKIELERLSKIDSILKEEIELLKEKMNNDEIKTSELKLNEFKRELAQVENQQVRVESEQESIQRALDEYSSQTHKYESQLNTSSTDLDELITLVENKEKDLEEYKFKSSSLNDFLDEKKEELIEAKSELKKTKKEWDELHLELDHIKAKIQKSQEKIHNLEIEQERFLVEKENLLNNAKDEEIDLLESDNNVEDDNYSVKDLDRKITKLNEQQKSLEPINMRAIEEFEKLDSRLNELTEHRDILNEEHSAIEDFIIQIEAEKLNTFMRTYTSISRHFSRIYRELSDGTGRMILEKPDTVFDGGVDIEANPKGKKVRNLGSLSGGEKALCALSFIFAIQYVDNQPFYVLDEVDAALDPGNVDKLARKVLELSRPGEIQGVIRKGAQFIVISHREILMAKSDLIWGVTSKNGVTQLWQMSLDDFQAHSKELGFDEEIVIPE